MIDRQRDFLASRHLWILVVVLALGIPSVVLAQEERCLSLIELSGNNESETIDVVANAAMVVDAKARIALRVSSRQDPDTRCPTLAIEPILVSASALAPGAIEKSELFSDKEVRPEEFGVRVVLLDGRRTGLSEGTVIDLQVSVVLRDGEGRAPVESEDGDQGTAEDSGQAQSQRVTYPVTLYVTQLGWNVDYSDTLVFVRNQFSKDWKLTQGALAAVGYKFDTEGAGPWTRPLQRFWNAADPHIGVAMNILDFDPDISPEYGVAGTVTFFGGNVLVGWGENLSVEFESNRYVFLGLSLVKIGDLIVNSRD
jgi:hypothetical protein